MVPTRYLLLLLALLIAPAAHADRINPFTGVIDFDSDLTNEDVTGLTVSATNLDCTVFGTTGYLSTDASGNFICDEKPSQIIASSYASSQSASFSCGLPGNCALEATTQEAIVRYPIGGTLRNLRANVGSAPGAGKSWTVTVIVANSATDLECVISGTATTCNDLANSISISENQTLGIRFVANNSPNVTLGAGFSVEFIPN